MKKNFLLLIITISTLQSCKKNEEKINIKENVTTDTSNKKNPIETEIEEVDETENFDEEQNIVYPQKGNNALDFLPKTDTYEIQYETKGDLNNDGLEDIVVVFTHIENKTIARPMLILLQNEDKSYRLDKVSNNIMPGEYNDADFKMFSSEEIEIKKGILKVNLYGSGGPSGNIFSHFKYYENDLVLTYIETYNTGAGSWQSLYYDLEKSELTEEITNTMKDDMPVTEKKFKLKTEKHFFETCSPYDVISEAYKKVEGNW